MSMNWQAFFDCVVSWLVLVILTVLAFEAFAQTITFDDGTVIELLDDEQIYVSTEPLYELREAESLGSELEPFSKPWCEAYLAANQPLTFESIDTRRRCERIVGGDL